MSHDRAGEYRRKALECIALAGRATSPENQANWLQMAEGWQRMADNQERSRGHAGLDPGSGPHNRKLTVRRAAYVVLSAKPFLTVVNFDACLVLVVRGAPVACGQPGRWRPRPSC
jgi:ferric-dicitrate binding protein FerR (iron transport regulator)